MKQNHQQSDPAKYQQLVAKFRQAYPPSTSVFSNFLSYLRTLGGHLINSLNAFYNYFQKQAQAATKSNKIQEGKKNQPGQQDQPQNKGINLNFNDFEFDDSLHSELESQSLKNESYNLPVRSFQFKMEEGDGISEEEDKNKQQDQDLLFLKRIGTKKIKVSPTYENNKNLIENVINQPPQVTKHFRQIFNQVTLDRAEILLEARQLREKEEAENAQKDSIEQMHQKYLKRIGVDNQKDGIKGGYKRIGQMIKKRREIVQKKPPRKRAHVEKDAPPIYSVQKVLQVLEMQKQQFFKQKRMKLQEEARAKRELERLQELERQKARQLQQEKRMRQQKQIQQRIRKEKQQRQRQQKILQAPANEGQETLNRLEISSQLEVIPQKGEPIASKDLLQNENKPISLIQESKVENQGIKNSMQSVIVSPQRSKEQPPKEIFSTPPRKGAEQTPKQSNNQPNKSVIKQNPFITKNASPLKAPSFFDIIKKEPAGIFPPQGLTQPTVGSTLFAQNTSGPNLFNNGPLQSNIASVSQPSFQASSPNFNSPTVFLTNPIQKNLQTIMPQPAQSQFPFFKPSPTSSIQNNPGSANVSNISSFSNVSNASIFPTQNPLTMNSGPPEIGRTFGSLLGNNQELVKRFDRNLFAPNTPQPQVISLFGPSTQQANRQPASRGNRKDKKQIRVGM